MQCTYVVSSKKQSQVIQVFTQVTLTHVYWTSAIDDHSAQYLRKLPSLNIENILVLDSLEVRPLRGLIPDTVQSVNLLHLVQCDMLVELCAA